MVADNEIKTKEAKIEKIEVKNNNKKETNVQGPVKVEEENQVDPNNYKIITSKKYKKLTWYLIFKKNKTNKDNIKNSQNQNQNVINVVENIDENNYINYKWVTGLVIKRDQLEKFNKFLK